MWTPVLIFLEDLKSQEQKKKKKLLRLIVSNFGEKGPSPGFSGNDVCM